MAERESTYGRLSLPETPPADRPYVLVNMVSSVDGRVSEEGKSSGIGSRVDRACMRELRSHVDAVMVGAGSLRAEKMSLGLDRNDARQPMAVIVGGTGGLPLGNNLIIRDQQLTIALPEGAQAPKEADRPRARILRTPAGEGGVDLRHLLKALRTRHGVERLLVEGGPSLNRALVEAGLADELFLTLAPKLLLGQEHAALSGATGGRARDLALISTHVAGSELFLRYRLQAAD